MKSGFRLDAVIVTASIALGTAAAGAQTPDYRQLAQQAVSELAAGQFAAVEQLMKPAMAQEVPEQILQMVWMHIVRRFGAFQQITGATIRPVKDQELVQVACQFARGPVTVQWILDRQGQITGLHFQ